MEDKSFTEYLRTLNRPTINNEQYKIHLRCIMEGVMRDTKRNAQKGIHECKGYLANAGWDDDTYGISEAPNFSGLKEKLPHYTPFNELYQIPIDNTIVFQSEEIEKYISDVYNELKKLGFKNFTCRKIPYKKYTYSYSELKTTSKGFFKKQDMYYELTKTLSKLGYAIYVYLKW